MAFIFYLLTFFTSIVSIPIILKWRSIYKRYSILEKFSVQSGKKFTFESDNDFKVAMYVLVYYFMVLLSIIGLLSSNWFLFICILIISISFSYISKSIKHNKIKNYLLGFSFTISSLILMFIPINYFHLGIDVLEELKNYLY
jgi:hypothetical protein